MTSEADRAQHHEAREILGTCTAATYRPLVAWAAGVVAVHHAIHFARIPLVPDQMGSEYAGGSLPHGRMYLETRKGFSVTAGNDAVVFVTWREVADLVRPGRVAHLPSRIEAALVVRRELTGRSARPRSVAAEELSQLRQANDEECGAIGDEIWRLCRPVLAEEQMGLF